MDNFRAVNGKETRSFFTLKFARYLLILFAPLYGISQTATVEVNDDCFIAREPIPIVDFSVSGPILFESKGLEGRTNVLAGDIDNDGVVEILAKTGGLGPGSPGTLQIFNGSTGELENSFGAIGGIDTPMAIADVDLDGDLELFFSNHLMVQSLEHDGTLRWESLWPSGPVKPQSAIQSIHLVDFNADGIPEIFRGNTIFNADTGTFLVTGPSDGHIGNPVTNKDVNVRQPISTAADVLPDFPGPELIAGQTVYSVDITNPNGSEGNSINAEIVFGENDGHSYPIDVDLDGQLDIITAVDNGVIAWNPRTGEELASGPGAVGGIFMIGNIDEDPHPEVASLNQRGVKMVAYDFDLGNGTFTEKWSIIADDTSSRWTGASMFDFNGDGLQEILYRDQTKFRVLNGPDGEVLYNNNATRSFTRGEYPVIADIDNDNEAEIVIAADGGALHVYESGEVPWQPARRIWNQYAYRVTAVNDDGTIPRTEVNSATLVDGIPLYNVNNVQVASLDGGPRDRIQQSDVGIEILGLDCATGEVSFELSNYGLAEVPSNTPIVFYDGDPESGVGAMEVAHMYTVGAIPPGGVVSLTLALFEGPSLLPYGFHGVVNVAPGSPLPLDFEALIGDSECSLNNNKDGISGDCSALCGDFSMDATVSQPDCEVQGSISLSVMGGVPPYVSYVGRVALADPMDRSAYSDRTEHTDLEGGNYHIYVMDSLGCLRELGPFMVEASTEPLSIQLLEVDHVPCGTLPEVVVQGGSPPYQWSVGEGAYGSMVPDLSRWAGRGPFTVHVEDSRGCRASVEGEVPLAAELLASIEVVPSCTQGEDGYLASTVHVVTAEGFVLEGAQYSLDGSGYVASPVFEGVSPGEHTVTIVHANICEGPTLDFSINAVLPMSLTVTDVVYDPCDGGLQYPGVSITGGAAPYQWSLDGSTYTDDMILPAVEGSFTLWARDSMGCLVSAESTILKGSSVGASVTVSPNCGTNGAGSLLHEVAVSVEGEAQGEVLYALDSGDIADFGTTAGFTGVPPGEHYVSVLHASGCLDTVSFEVPEIRVLSLSLTATGNLNEMAARAMGGVAPYTFHHNGAYMGGARVFDVTQDGPQEVMVVDALGCTVTATLDYELVDICIPDHFTPDATGKGDSWQIDFKGYYPNSRTFIYDRYGRLMAELRQDGFWDGNYNGMPLPTGDYWYQVQLNHEKDNRTFVGHFTLYR